MGTKKARFIELHGEEAWQEHLKKDRERYVREREKRIAYQSKYNEEHREEINKRQREYGAKYYDTPKGRACYLVSGYRCMDKNRGIGETTITQEWILENIFKSKCIYCGNDNWRELGCDRIDNNLPHTPENVVCACVSCNNTRADRYSVEEFMAIRQQKGTALLLSPAS